MKIIKHILCILMFTASVKLTAQVAINNTGALPDTSALVDMQSVTKGLLIPRVTTLQRNNIVSPAKGLIVYNLDCDNLNFNAGTPQSPNWVAVNSANSLPASVTITSVPAGAICQQTIVTFSAAVTNGGTSPTYQWQKNGLNISGATSPVFVDSSVSNGIVITCVITSNLPCVTGSPATSNSISEIVSAPSPVSVVIAANPSGTICSGSNVTFTATPSNGGAVPQYQWLVNGMEAAGAANATYATDTLSNNDAVTCVLTSSLQCVSNSPATSNSISVSVIQSPSSSFTPSSGTQNMPVTFSPADSGAAYSWTFSSGSPDTSSSQNPAVTWSSTGSYNVSLTVSEGGCSSTTNSSIVINSPTPHTFNPTNPGSANGSIQYFTVPENITSITIQANGAQGGTAYNGSYNFVGGKGASMTGTFSVTPGQVLGIVVGQQGGSYSDYNTGGGGGSFVWDNASSAIMIAAGGGGGGGNDADGLEQGTTNNNGNNGQQVNGAYNGGAPVMAPVALMEMAVREVVEAMVR